MTLRGKLLSSVILMALSACGTNKEAASTVSTYAKCSAGAIRDLGWVIRLNAADGTQNYITSNNFYIQPNVYGNSVNINFYMGYNNPLTAKMFSEHGGIVSYNIFSDKKTPYSTFAVIDSNGLFGPVAPVKEQSTPVARRHNLWQKIDTTPASSKFYLRHISVDVGCG